MDKNIGLHEEGVLPGFRFHPTEEELLNFYLRRTAMGINTTCSKVIGFLNIYRHHPSELPGLAKITGEREWYFFVHRDRKHGHGGRPARTTEHGFWKATGSDRQIRSLSEPKMILGLKKTLVFYKGRAPKGIKTDWIMNEYRLPDIHNNNKIPPPKEDIVLCKIYRKATSLKILEQRAAAMEDHHQVKSMINGTDHPISSWSSSPPSDEDSSTIDDPTNAYDHLESWFNNNTSTPSFITATLNHQDNNIDDYFEEDCDPAAATAVSIPPPLPPPSVESCSAVMCDMKDQAYSTCGDHSFNTPFVWMEQWSPYSNIHDF